LAACSGLYPYFNHQLTPAKEFFCFFSHVTALIVQDYDWYLTSIAEKLDTFQRMNITEERLVNVDTVVFLQVVK